ncbi:MAG: hypothetical protein JW725_04555 [Candidatus Babeliaceae bacterium]|nr:hypothetical protein [Candidatus Babeliaceae bacterium]
MFFSISAMEQHYNPCTLLQTFKKDWLSIAIHKKYLFKGKLEGTIEIIDLVTKKHIDNIKYNEASPNTLEPIIKLFAKNDKIFAESRYETKIWDLKSGKNLTGAGVPKESSSINNYLITKAIKFDSNHNLIGTINIYNLKDMKPKKSFDIPIEDKITQPRYRKNLLSMLVGDNKIIITNTNKSPDQHLYLPDNSTIIHKLGNWPSEGKYQRNPFIVESKDRKIIKLLLKFGYICIYNSPQVRSTLMEILHNKRSQEIDYAISTHNKIIFTVKNKIFFADHTGRTLKTLTGHDQGTYIHALCILSNLLFSGATDGTVKIWGILTGECLGTIRNHVSAITKIYGWKDIIVTSNSNHTLKVWRIPDSLKGYRTQTNLREQVRTTKRVAPNIFFQYNN